MSFEVGAFLPEGSQVFLQVSLLFLDLIMQRSPYIKIDRKKQVAIIPLKYCGIHVIGELMYPAGIKFKMKLLVKLPKISSQSQFEIFVRQVYQRREVGRITWKLKQAIIKRTKQ